MKEKDLLFFIPDDVRFILSSLENAGFEAFVVGGCVRDAIRQVPPKDWDVATSATPSQTKALFARSIDTGIKHGTITVLLGRNSYEVTTYRIDGEYLDSRRPESVTFSRKIDEDLSRRDFTMNAIAYNPSRGFVDPFYGRDDIDKGIIRCVGDATCRFSEDALRMLRAIRFAGVLGFSVDESALNAITQLQENLSNISAERIREELGKLLCGAYPQALMLLENTKLLTPVLRGYEYVGDLCSVIPQITACPPDEAMRLTLFLCNAFAIDCATDATSLPPSISAVSLDSKCMAMSRVAGILRDLRYDNKTIKHVTLYVDLLHAPLPHDRYGIKKLLRIVPHEIFENLLDLKAIHNKVLHLSAIEDVRREAQDIISSNECFTLRDLAVSGNDLAQAGIRPGKAMGNALELLLDAVMRDPSANVKETLINMALCSIPEKPERWFS